MKKSHKFSFSFDSELLHNNFEKLLPSWEMHFNTQYYSGNWSGIPLRAPVSDNHTLSATANSTTEFENTTYLEKSAYLEEVINTFKTPKQSIRLLRLTPGSHIKEHRDFGLGFFDGAVRIHIPILTNPLVDFLIEGENLRMKPGECWFANFNLPHSVANRGESDRVHLVIDLVTNAWLRNLFIKERIIEVNETEPEKHDDEEKRKIIASLKEMGTETSLEMAKKMERELNEH